MSSRIWALLFLGYALSADKLSGQELPPRAIARLGDYRFFHGASIELVAVSPDGSRIASLATKPIYFHHITEKDRDPFCRTIVVWDAATGRRIREIQTPDAPVRSILFTPDGKRLLVTNGQIKSKSYLVFFDLDSGKIVQQFGGFNDSIFGAQHPQLSAGGKHLLMSDGWDKVISFDLVAGKVQRRWQAPTKMSSWLKGREIVTHSVPSPDGKFIAWHVEEPPDYSKVPFGVHVPPWVPRPNVLIVSDAETEKVLYRKDIDKLGSFTFSPDGRWFMTASDKTVTAWATATGKEVFHLADVDASRMALSPDGRWALVAGSWSSRLWSLKTRQSVHEFYGTFGWWAGGQVFSADGKVVALWSNSTLRVYDTETGKERHPPDHRDWGIMVRFSTDGKTLYSTGRETRCIWDVWPAKPPVLKSHQPRKSWDVGDSDSGSGCNDSRYFVDEVGAKQLRIRDTQTGDVVRELDKDKGKWWGTFARFSPDATRLAVRRYLMETGYDEKGRYWLRGTDMEELKLFDTKTGKKTGSIPLKNRTYWVVPAFSPDGKTVAWVDSKQIIHLHDAVSGEAIRSLQSTQALPMKESGHANLIFSPDGTLAIVTTYNHELFADPNDAKKWNTLPTRVFDTATGKEIRRFYGNPEKKRSAAEFSCITCSPDNRLLAVAEKESAVIRLIEIESGKVRAEFKGHRDGVHDLAFSPDGKILASGGEDGVVYLWDVVGH